MNGQLPSNDHFKGSTRALLSQAQKREIIHAVDRASDHLLSLSYREGSFSQRMAPMRRVIMLIKGSTQSRHFYRWERHAEVWQHAWDIAEETGASVIDVHRSLSSLMQKYVP